MNGLLDTIERERYKNRADDNNTDTTEWVGGYTADLGTCFW